MKKNRALILLHGSGSSSRRILRQLKDLCDPAFYIVAPDAPDHHWYFESFLEKEEKNEPFLSMSIYRVEDLIQSISKSIPKSHIYIAGFSQGACLALEVAALVGGKFGAIIAFSGGLIGSRPNAKKYKGSFNGTKVFLGATREDPYIPFSRVKKSKEILEELGAEVTLNAYPGNAHEINEDEISFVKDNFIK
ncbi:MAG TPA: dienelactone hydrolase family protein [Chlamydiales bacterium]|nr:dienelactone hydrolase family protein [Chlamydiales bacterium]